MTTPNEATTHDPKTERDPEEVELLGRAHAYFVPRMQALLDSGKPSAEYTDEEAMTAAFGIIGAEWLAGRKFSLDRPQKCGWCIEAAGNDEVAFDLCSYFENTAAVRAHTIVCEHNPLVAQIAKARAAAIRFVATVDNLGAFAVDSDPRVMALAGPLGEAQADLWRALALDLDKEAARLREDIHSRCAVCGWPLAETIEEGCVRGNCSMRPLPATFYAPQRAKAESNG